MEKSDLERKMKAKLDEAGLSSKEVQKRFYEKEEEKEQLEKLLKN